MKKHSNALVLFAVSKQIPVVYSADRGRAEKTLGTAFAAILKHLFYLETVFFFFLLLLLLLFFVFFWGGGVLAKYLRLPVWKIGPDWG